MGAEIVTIINDESEVTRLQDFYARQRELEAKAITRAAVLHASWRPMLAGAVGAALVIAAVWVAAPKFSTREVVVEHVVQHDVPFANHIPQDKPFDNYVPHEVGAAPALAPRSSAERSFEGSKEWDNADVRGRILRASGNGFVMMTEAGEQSFFPSRLGADGKPENDESMRDDVHGLLGDLAICRPTPNKLFQCVALRGDREIIIPEFPIKQAKQSSAGPTSSATEMVAVDIEVGGYPVEAMVDTGCAWPMAVPKIYADALVRARLAIRAGASSTTFADGSSHEVGIIMIGSISVDGRVLHDVEASVSPSNEAPILLGLGALNRLGPYTITDGKLVFTGEQPA